MRHGGRLASTYGEHITADEALRIAEHQYLVKQRDDFAFHFRDDIAHGGEVRPGVGGLCHVDDDLAASALDSPAGGGAAPQA